MLNHLYFTWVCVIRTQPLDSWISRTHSLWTRFFHKIFSVHQHAERLVSPSLSSNKYRRSVCSWSELAGLTVAPPCTDLISLMPHSCWWSSGVSWQPSTRFLKSSCCPELILSRVWHSLDYIYIKLRVMERNYGVCFFFSVLAVVSSPNLLLLMGHFRCTVWVWLLLLPDTVLLPVLVKSPLKRRTLDKMHVCHCFHGLSQNIMT